MTSLPFDLAALLRDASQAEQLDNPGPDAVPEGLTVLVDALNAASLTSDQHAAATAVIGQRLGVALRVADWVSENPGVMDEAIEAPLVITGTDPAGVALLGSVLGLDVMNRVPLRWEAATVAPVPSMAARGHDPRIGSFGAQATAAASCSELLANGFHDSFGTQWPVPEFWKWWTEADHRTGYAFHRLQVQILQSALPTHQWVFHSSSHMWHLDALLHTYPDARVVWIHRDPAHVIEGLLRSGDRHASGDASLTFDAVAESLREAVPASLATRARHPETSFFDLQYVELLDDPIGAIERFYREWGISLPELSRWRMQAYLSEDGVLPAEVAPMREQIDQCRSEMADYITRFEIPSEVSNL